MTSQNALTLDAVRRLAPSAFALEPWQTMSPKYKYIPTVKIIEGMQQAGFFPFAASQSRTRIPGKGDFTKHLVRFRHISAQDHALAVGGTFPEIVLINSHDGTSAYKLLAGIFHLVCSNGLVVADSLQDSISIRHSGNIEEEVIEGSTRIVENAPKLLNAVNGWSQLQLTTGERQAFAEAAHTVRFGDSEGKVETPITPAQLLNVRRSDDHKTDLWTTFNVIQENAVKGGLTTRRPAQAGEWRGRRIRTREIKGIDQDVKLNRALWSLAERMAELKAQA